MGPATGVIRPLSLPLLLLAVLAESSRCSSLERIEEIVNESFNGGTCGLRESIDCAALGVTQVELRLDRASQNVRNARPQPPLPELCGARQWVWDPRLVNGVVGEPSSVGADVRFELPEEAPRLIRERGTAP